MNTFARLQIGALTGFVQAPHPDARMVIGFPRWNSKVGELVHAGWLMPPMGEVDEKTARFYAAKAKRENAGRAPKGWTHAGPVEVQAEGEAS